MELTLNLVWVCVAVAAILAQIVTLSASGASLRRPRSYVRKMIAMGCALVILFFVISMTDDLHNQQVLVEERKSSRNAAVTATATNPGSLRPVPTHFLLFFSPLTPSTAAAAARRRVENTEFLPTSDVADENLCGRAPPPPLS
jgi:threonine/homoserine/homoserine lactone efflux protein